MCSHNIHYYRCFSVIGQLGQSCQQYNINSNVCSLVSVLPRIIPFSFGDSPIFAGEAGQVTCLVSAGDLPLEIFWTVPSPKNRAWLGISVTKVGGKASTLLIDSATHTHRGDYTCTAKNRAGVTQFTTSLEIHGT